MSDVRDATDPLQAVSDLQKQVNDLASLLAARTSSRPTGDIEPTFRTTPKAGAIFCQGQTLQRSDYPTLVQWITDQGLFGTVFGAGDGSNTFVMPNAQGRVLRVLAASGETIGQLIGSDSVALSTANLPSHNHSVTVADHPQHNHNFLTDQNGAHGGHFPASGPVYVAPQANASGVAAWNDPGSGVGTHNHGGVTAYQAISSHSVTQANVGSGTAHENRQASIAVNLMMWT